MSVSIFNIIITYLLNIDSFKCKLSKVELKFLNSASDYTIILSGDCFILFEHIDEQNAKIIFWCSLYAISDIQIIQSLKSAAINFFEMKPKKDFVLKLYIENIVLFRDILITRMKALNIKISIKIIDSNSEKNEQKRLTIKDMARMSLFDIEKNIKEMKQTIDKGEIDEYTINTFSTLCGKVIDELNKSFDKKDEEKQKKYKKLMEDVYKFEKIDDFNNNEINQNDDINININNNKDKNEIKNCINIIEENKIEINNDKNEEKIDSDKDKNIINENNKINSEDKNEIVINDSKENIINDKKENIIIENKDNVIIDDKNNNINISDKNEINIKDKDKNDNNIDSIKEEKEIKNN